MGRLFLLRWDGPDRSVLAKARYEVAAKVADLARSRGIVLQGAYFADETQQAFVIGGCESAEGALDFTTSEEFRSALTEAGVSPPDEVLILEPIVG